MQNRTVDLKEDGRIDRDNDCWPNEPIRIIDNISGRGIAIYGSTKAGLGDCTAALREQYSSLKSSIGHSNRQKMSGTRDVKGEIYIMKKSGRTFLSKLFDLESAFEIMITNRSGKTVRIANCLIYEYPTGNSIGFIGGEWKVL